MASPLSLVVLLVSFALLASMAFAAAPAVVGSSYYTREGRPLRSPVHYGVLDVEFDDDIYRFDGIPICNDATVCMPPRNASCPVCDYTDPAVCNGTGVKAGCSCPYLIACQAYHNGVLPEKLELNTEYNFYMPASDYHEFYFTFDPDDSCSFVEVDLIPQWGDPDVYIASAYYYDQYIANAPYNFNIYGEIWGIEDWSVCPSQHGFFRGTFIIGVYSFGSQLFATGLGSNFTVTIRTHKLPDAANYTNSGPCFYPAGTNSSTHICVEDNNFTIIDFSTDLVNVDHGGAVLGIYIIYPNPNGGPVTFYRDTNTAMYNSFTAQFPLSYVRTANDYSGVDRPELVEQVVQGQNFQDVMTLTITQPTPLYLGMLDFIRLSEGAFVYFTKYYQDWTTLKPLTVMSHFEWMFLAHGTTRMECLDSSGNPEDFHCFRKISDVQPGDCLYFWPITPLPDPNPLYPRPTFSIRSSKWQNLAWFEGQWLKPMPKHYMSALLLSGAVETTDQPYIRLNNSADNIKSCKMWFRGNLANAKGDIIHGFNVSFTEEKNPTPQETFVAVSKRIEKYLEQINTLSGLQLGLTQYQIDVLELSAPFFNTIQLAKSLFTTKEKEVTILTTECLNKNNSDPCCVPSLGWTGAGCQARLQSQTVQVFDEPTDNLYTECKAPRAGETQNDYVCTLNAAQDYSALATQDSLSSCARSGLYEEWIVRREMQPYRKCRDMYLGKGVDMLHPNPCSVDADCSILGGNFTCDVVHKTCLVPIKTRWLRFFGCLIQDGGLDAFIIFNIAEQHGQKITAGSAYLTDPQLWLDIYEGSALPGDDGVTLGVNECIDPKGFLWAFPHRFHYNLRPVSVSTICLACKAPNCFDQYCTLPFECNVRFDTTCYQSWHDVSMDPDACNNDIVCNWDYNIKNNATAPDVSILACEHGGDALATSAIQVCAVTDNGVDFVRLNGISAAACSTFQGCALANGSVIPTPLSGSTSTCTASSYSTCDHAKYTTQATCEAAGHCTNDYWFTNATGVVYSTVCLLPPNPWFKTQCDNFQNGGRPVKDGCLRYELNQAQCQAKGGVMVTPATTRASCEGLGYICVIPVTDSRVVDYFLDEMYTYQNRDDCLAQEGARWEPRYQWVAARWLPPTPKTTRTITAALVPRWTVSQNTTILSALLADLDTAIQAKVRFQRKSYTFCRFGRYSATLAEIECGCTSSASSVADCFVESVTANAPAIGKAAAITDVCGGAGVSIVASPVLATFTEKSLSPYGACVSVSLVTVPALRYQSSTGGNTATFFIDFSEKTDWSFRNSKDALVGQVIGDGVGVFFNASYIPSTTVTITSAVKICTQRRSDIIEIQDSSYIELDFAPARMGSTELVPLNVPVTEDPLSHQLCAEFLVENGVAYMPVQRAQSWQTKEHEVFTQGEFITLIVVVCCYSLTIIFAIYKLHPLAILRTFHFGVGVSIPIVALYIVRLIYFALLLSGAISVNEANVGIFILIELPILLYFSTTLYFVVNWAFVTRTIKKLGPAKNLRPKIMRAFAGTNIALYLIFIAFLLAFALAVKKPYSLCDGKVTVTDNLTGKLISTVYRLFMGILALLLGVGFMVLGTQLYCSVKDAKFATDKFKRTIYMQASLCSISLVAEAVFLITIALLPTYNNNIFSMAWMLVCEIAPGVTILWFLDIKALQKAADTTRTMASTKATMKSMYEKESSAGSSTNPTGSQGKEATGASE